MVVGACFSQTPAVEGRRRLGNGDVPWRNYARRVKDKVRRHFLLSDTSCRRKLEAGDGKVPWGNYARRGQG
jgi:hypothetical protein